MAGFGRKRRFRPTFNFSHRSPKHLGYSHVLSTFVAFQWENVTGSCCVKTDAYVDSTYRLRTRWSGVRVPPGAPIIKDLRLHPPPARVRKVQSQISHATHASSPTHSLLSLSCFLRASAGTARGEPAAIYVRSIRKSPNSPWAAGWLILIAGLESMPAH